ncbi:MAG: hypothetical protein PHQ23_00585 [Candidatus Wallbacteria bacterium]|nr:hypothetical protein [Candidatus Wallbacteria bacterium]
MISKFSMKLAAFSALAFSATIFGIACLKNGPEIGLKKAVFSILGGGVFGGGLGEVLLILFPHLQYTEKESIQDRTKADYIFPELESDEQGSDNK